MIEAQHVALLASVGCSRPLVSRRPTVGVIATGSELVEVGRQPGPCQIRNSNSFQLSALVLGASRGFRPVADQGIKRFCKAMATATLSSCPWHCGDHDFVAAFSKESSI
jgi:molybdopterin biosynthesis enzyme